MPSDPTFSSHRISGGGTEITVLSAGGKISSIRMLGKEWLKQPRSSPSAPPAGAIYNETEMWGWDEMFPTITGRRHPDHGYLWTQEWETTDADSSSVTQRAHLARGSLGRERRQRTGTDAVTTADESQSVA